MGKGQVLAAEGNLVLGDLVHDLLVGVLKDKADLSADVAKSLPFRILSVDPHFAGQSAPGDVGDDAADDGQEGAFPFPRVSGKKSDFPVFGDEADIIQDIFLLIVGESDLIQFDCVHKTTTRIAPTVSPRRNKMSERTGHSFL